MTSISVQHLSKVFEKHSFWGKTLKSFTAVNDISFTIKKGEFVGFLGPNGAGKTTTLKMLSGILVPSTGNINVLGHTPAARENSFKRKISMVMGQKSQLWWELPPIDTFELFKTIYQVDPVHFQKQLDKLVSLLEVSDCLSTPTRQLSLGQRMKCELIAALLHDPEVLFLDEPTIGLDYSSQKKMREFLRNYNAETKSTILLTSHYTNDIKELCPRIIVINHGSIIYDGEFKTLEKQVMTHKEILLELAEDNTYSDWATLGEIIHYDNDQIRLRVRNQTVNAVLATITQKARYQDIQLIDPDAGEIITSLLRQ